MLKTIIDNDTFFEVVKAELAHNKTVSFKVKGQSMWPFYHDGLTTVLVSSATSLKKYDVVLANYQGKVILHRIIQIQGDSITLRGDATFRKEVVSRSEVFARVVEHQTKKTIPSNQIRYRFKVWLWVHNPLRKLCIRLRSIK
ncbi:S24/S26 family peptidase [Paracholeplasma manati]|uniref:S24/S26 family peptidase n=1 Tax=Paracholeplasma manati TaxID=591373 RepID=UPI0024082A08|nr:S24/S26 family peptidase [Paracholeplasma manati]MDG0889485.1 S24/S26 family peptidase [Paracholeplasma manati]